MADDTATLDDRSKGDTSVAATTTGTQGLPDLSMGLGPQLDIGKLIGPTGSLTQQTETYTNEMREGRRAEIYGADADMARVRRAFNEEGIGPNELQKWNADAEREKFMTKPVDAFGSLGSVFGILASAFTRQPMENALNASAAAMNAVHAGDEEVYKQSFNAWKENTALALKRQQLMHQKYTDAIELMKTNMALGQTKLQLAAAQYGDDVSLTYMRAGLNDKLFDTLEKRAKTAEELQKVSDSDMERQFANRVLENRNQQINQDYQQKREQIDQLPDSPEKTMMANALEGKRTGELIRAAADSHFLTKSLQSGDPKWHLLSEWALSNPEDAADPDKMHDAMVKFGLIYTPATSTATAAQLEKRNRGIALKYSTLKADPANKDKPDEELYYQAERETDQELALDKTTKAPAKLSDFQTRIAAYRKDNPDATEQQAIDAIDKESFKAKELAIKERLAGLKDSQFNTHEEFLERQAQLKYELAKTALEQKALPKSIKDRTIIEMADQYEAKALEAHPDVTGPERGKIHTDAVLQATRDYAANNKGQEPLDPQGVNLMVNQYYDTGRVPIGLSRSGPFVAAFWKRAAEVGVQKYGSAEAASEHLRAAQAEFEGQKAAERTAAQRLTSISIATQDAANLLGPMEKASDLVPRGQFPKVNEFKQFLAKESGDPNIRQFQASVTSFISAYTRALSPTGVPTDNARDRAFSLLSTADSPAAFKAVVKQLQTEMDAVLRAPVQVLVRLRQDYGNNWSDTQKKEAKKAADSFMNVRTKNGKTYYKWDDGSVHDEPEYK